MSRISIPIIYFQYYTDATYLQSLRKLCKIGAMPTKQNTSDREMEEVTNVAETAVSEDYPTNQPNSTKQFLVAEEVVEAQPEIESSQDVVAPPVRNEETGRIFPKSTMDRSDKSPKWLLWITIILVTLATAVVGAILVMRKSSSTPAEETPVVSDTTPTPTATPTPTPALSRTGLKVQVLNGSGVTGKAATAKTILEDLGYTDVKTGNASSTDYETTEISIKPSKNAYASLIKSDLEDEYTLDSKIGVLEEDDDYDIVIILGTE
jgi:hypothetical protein